MTALAPCMVSDGTVIETFTDHETWVLDTTYLQGNSSESEPEHPYEHHRCLDACDKVGLYTYRKPLTTTPALAYMTKTTGLSLNLLSMTSLRLDFSLGGYGDQGPTLTQWLSFDIASVTNFSKYMSFSTKFSPGMEYNRLRMDKTAFTAVGGESWSNTMIAMRIGFVMPYYTYGCLGSPKWFFDKLVKDPVSIGLVTIGVDCSASADTDIYLDALSDNGLSGKAYGNMLDYDNVGDATYNTWPQLVALEAAGIKLYPNFTPWLLQAPYNAVRPVPPYPAYDADYSMVTDLDWANEMGLEHYREVMLRMRRLHDYYGIPWRTDFFMPHNGNFNNTESAHFLRSSGCKAWAVRADWNKSGPYKSTLLQTLPTQGEFGYWMVYANAVNHADVTTAIDEVAAHNGAYLNLCYSQIGSASDEWLEADLRSELAHIKAHQDAGDLLVVSPSEFIALTTRTKKGVGGGA